MDRATLLVERARAETGLSDFGGEGFREGLDRLEFALEREADLNAMGRAAMDAQIVDLLSNRLRVEACYAQFPDIEDETIVAPLIGLGLPRTASTALACMLGEDPAFRTLHTWESMRPCPPPDPARLAEDPRIAQAQAAMDQRAQRFPRMTAMLPSTATSPTECQLFMAYEFKSQFFQPFARIPSYVNWLLHEADMVPAYRTVKRVLKLLQFRWPSRGWRLKNPSHSLFIEALNEVFPDARFVMTHRSPAAVVGSVADLFLELRKAFSDKVDMAALGEETTTFCEVAMRRMIAFREGREARFFDIGFTAFQHDSLAVIEDLYAFCGDDLSEQARAAMLAWRLDRPRDAAVYERTPPAAFGLDRARLEDRFRFYTDRFGAAAA